MASGDLAEATGVRAKVPYDARTHPAQPSAHQIELARERLRPVTRLVGIVGRPVASRRPSRVGNRALEAVDQSLHAAVAGVLAPRQGAPYGGVLAREPPFRLRVEMDVQQRSRAQVR